MWACMHSVRSVCHYAPLPCVNAAWHWQEEPGETIIGTEADPQTAGGKSRPRALPAANQSVLLGPGPLYLAWLLPAIALPPMHTLHPRAAEETVMTLFTSEVLGVPSPRSVIWSIGNQDNASLYFWVIYCLFFFSSSLSTLFDLELWPLPSHWKVSQGVQHLHRSSHLA